MKYQILVDSASDLRQDYLKEPNIGFKVIPLTILVNDQEYVDDDNINPEELLEAMHASKKNSSACPAPQSFLQEFDNSEYTFVVTITSKLSGCYNSALVAKNDYSKSENIHVIDSKGASGTETLIVDKLVELINQGLSFEEIKTQIEAFRDEKELFFMLNKFDNLVNNGRMSKIAGLIASTLVIRPICIANDGEIKIAKKIIGSKNAISKMLQMIYERVKDGPKKTLIISHCLADTVVDGIKKALEEANLFKEIKIFPTKGLCSYYALEKGLILCY